MRPSDAWVLDKLRELAADARATPERAKARAAELLPNHGPDDPLGYRLAAETGMLHAFIERVAVDLDALVSVITDPPKRARRRR